jgi:hypothetical protein
MKKLFAILAAAIAVAAIGVTAAVSSGDGRTVLKFDTMAPVVPPYTGVTNPIRGVNGGGVAWELESAQGRLRADGRLDIDVEGLVVVSSGVNPSPTFRGVVSCLSSNAAGEPATAARPSRRSRRFPSSSPAPDPSRRSPSPARLLRWRRGSSRLP